MSVAVVVVVVIIGMKIARSRVLGICVCCKHNESVDIGEKLVFVHLELLNMAHKRYSKGHKLKWCSWNERTRSCYETRQVETVQHLVAGSNSSPNYSACLWFTDCTYSAPCAFYSCAQLQLR